MNLFIECQVIQQTNVIFFFFTGSRRGKSRTVCNFNLKTITSFTSLVSTSYDIHLNERLTYLSFIQLLSKLLRGKHLCFFGVIRTVLSCVKPIWQQLTVHMYKKRKQSKTKSLRGIVSLDLCSIVSNVMLG